MQVRAHVGPGKESGPPCGPGVVVGQYYPYTLPGQCDGRIIFDGRTWQSELPPPTEVSPFPVWMGLTATGRLGFISPRGAVGFDPVGAGPPPPCRR